MSLHLGNLSPRVRKDELEHVFRKFGRCNVRIKDRFGFVVYDYPAQAEKALKTLGGQKICGEHITLSWSNRQPRAPRSVQRYGRGGRSYEPLQKRQIPREDGGLRPNGRQGYRRDRQVDSEKERFGSSDRGDESRRYVEGKEDAYVDIHNEAQGVTTSLLDSDRWEDQVADPVNENGSHVALEFDRYEPYGGDDKKEQEENHNGLHLDGSLTLMKSEGKTETEHLGRTKLDDQPSKLSLKGCFICGDLGHKMRNCPQDPKGLGSNAQGRPRMGSDIVPTRGHKNSGESSSRNHQRLRRHDDSPKGRRKDYREKKRGTREHESPERQHAKKARRRVSSPGFSDYTVSGSLSPSRSLRSVSVGRSHSKSTVPSRTKPALSSSRSSSLSHHHMSGKVKSRTISRSNSLTSFSSLSASLGEPLLSSPNKVWGKQKNPPVAAHDTELKEDRGTLQIESDGKVDECDLENMTDAVAPLRYEDNIPSSHDAHKGPISRHLHELEDSYTLQETNSSSRNLTSRDSKEIRAPGTDSFVPELDSAPVKVSETEISLSNDAMNISPGEMYTVLKHYGLELPEENDRNLPPEAFFGSARLWPWQMIYYRRLKKGPISTENYARRVAQNKEFHIVDKYIRSSSGWVELSKGSC